MSLPPDDRDLLAERVAARLRDDPELREAFERTPGKVAQLLGIPAEAVAAVLTRLSDPAPG